MIKDFIILALIGTVAWFGYSHFEDRIKEFLGFGPPAAVHVLPEQFVCDGRIYCTQMTSCEEATFFLRNCPRQRMDPDGEGIACKVQWCKKS